MLSLHNHIEHGILVSQYVIYLGGPGAAANGCMGPGIWLDIASQLAVQAALAAILGGSRLTGGLPNGPKARGGHLQQAAHGSWPGRGCMAAVCTMRLG